MCFGITSHWEYFSIRMEVSQENFALEIGKPYLVHRKVQCAPIQLPPSNKIFSKHCDRMIDLKFYEITTALSVLIPRPRGCFGYYKCRPDCSGPQPQLLFGNCRSTSRLVPKRVEKLCLTSAVCILRLTDLSFM